MAQKRYLTAEEAAEALGISRATLYSYVSRGLIHSEPAGEGTRSHRYRAEDVARLKRRKAQRRNPAVAAQQALHFGAPVLESAITLLDEGRLTYRGQDALRLATGRTVEEVAALIWMGDVDADVFAEADVSLPEAYAAVRPHLGTMTPVERFQVALPLAAEVDLAAYDVRPAGVVATGARIVQLLVELAAGHPAGAGLVDALQRGWGLDAGAVPILNAALILCADHELNVSSFTARCVASAGSTPYQVVLAGLAALQGVKHGGHTERVAALLQEVGGGDAGPAGVRAGLARRLKRGEPIPGFGHPLYPAGDPRARLLLQLVRERDADHPAVHLADAVTGAAGDLIGERPTIDFALVIAAQALDLPPGAPLALFALGRTIGWIGHALEQYETDQLIRPRARYVGKMP